jgi:hypothetical protein
MGQLPETGKMGRFGGGRWRAQTTKFGGFARAGKVELTLPNPATM